MPIKIGGGGGGGSGSPKGTYASLAALTAALPVGSANIYVTIDDGNWNYWNGTAWTAGGIYLSNPAVVNDLTTGGTDVPLSAEMGKDLNSAVEELYTYVPAEMHRNIYRGKNLGTSVTAAQKAAITTRKYTDLFIGDYWVIGGKTWRIADIDYWYNHGNTAFTKPHLVMVPDAPLYNHVMNDTYTTEGGYVGSKMRIEGLDAAKTTIQAAFGEMLLTHREFLVNAVSSGVPSGSAWFDSTVDLMNECMVYGSYIRGIPYSTNSKQQLSIFRLNPKVLNKRQSLWLRDVVSSTSFAYALSIGSTSIANASNAGGIRPVFAIG